jgi:hypothetical protein
MQLTKIKKRAMDLRAILKKPDGKCIHYTHLFFFFLFTLIVCTKPEPPKSWLFYPDSFDYIEQSKHPYGSVDLYSPHRTALHARAFTVPLFYKITGSDFYTFMSFQTVFYCICVFLFMASLLPFFRNPYLKIAFIFLLYFFFSWWNMVGWTNLCVSEHLSFCFLLLWLATLIRFLSKKNIPALVLHLAVSILHSFTRDTWSYLIVLTPLILAVFYFKEKKFVLRYLTAYLVFASALFFIQQKTINKGERYRLSVYNNVFARLARNPAYIDWFKERGLPAADKIRAEFATFKESDQQNLIKLYESYTNPEYAPVFDWVVKRGKSDYMQFLLTHPRYLFLMDQTKEERARIFCYNLSYTGAAVGYYELPGHVFPLFNGWVVLGLCVVICIVFIRTKGVDPHLLFPLFLLLLCIANVFLSYNAEAIEVERHMYYTTILLEVIAFISVFLLADRGISYWQQKRVQKGKTIVAEEQ